MSATVTQVGYLAQRSVLRTLRTPIMIVPALAFPLILVAVNASGLDSATELPGFPTDSYVTFALAFAFLQGAMFATINGGTSLAMDIQQGFFNRLQLTPLRGAAMIAGQLAGVLLVGAVQVVVYLSIGLLFGGSFEAGLAGLPVLFALSLAISAAFGAFGLWIGLRTGSGEAVQGSFPLLFIVLFFSSMTLPRDLIEQDWFRTIADWNPVSYMLEGIRSLFIDGWDPEALALGFGFAAVLFAIAIAASASALRTRMERT